MDVLDCIRYHLDARRLAYELFTFPRRGTPLSALPGLGEGQLSRGVLLQGHKGAALAVIPADRILDAAAAAALCGRPLHAAAPDAITRAFPALAPGPIPPLPLYGHLPVLVDERIGTADGVYFHAGKDTLLRMQSDAFQRLHAGALWGDISRRPPHRRRLRSPLREHAARIAWVPTAVGPGSNALRH